MTARRRNKYLGIFGGILFPIFMAVLIWYGVLWNEWLFYLTVIALMGYYIHRYTFNAGITGTIERWGAGTSYIVTGVLGGVILGFVQLFHITNRMLQSGNPDEMDEFSEYTEEDIEIMAQIANDIEPIGELVIVIGAGLPDETSVRGLSLMLLVTIAVWMEISKLVFRPWQRLDAWRNGDESSFRTG